MAWVLECTVQFLPTLLEVFRDPCYLSVLQSASMDLLSTLHPMIYSFVSRAVFVLRPVAQ